MTQPADPLQGPDGSDPGRSLRELLGETMADLAGVLGQERGLAVARVFLALGSTIARSAADLPEGERHAIRQLLDRLSALPAFTAEEPLEVRVNGEAWRPVGALDDTGSMDPVYTFDPLSGTLRFGDGVQGRRPPGGSAVTVGWRQGAGSSLTVRFPWPPPRRTLQLEMDPQGGLRLREPPPPPSAGGVLPGEPLRRVVFWEGRLLTAADLREEQADHLRRCRRHNRLLHGVGVVDGLAVSLDAPSDSAPARVTVQPGFALDPLGREIGVPTPLELALPTATEAPQRLILLFEERPVDPVPLEGQEEPVPTRIEEGARLALALAEENGSAAAVDPCPWAGEGVMLARLLGGEGGWRLDPGFAPLRPLR